MLLLRRFGGYGDFTEPWLERNKNPGPGTYETEVHIDEDQGLPAASACPEEAAR